MPIYEYRCDKCEHEFERSQRITDDPVKTCPECRSRRVKKLISQTSFVLKGSGWYSDLYSSAKPETDKSDSGKSDSKNESASPEAGKVDSNASKDSQDSKKSKDKKSPKSKGKKGSSKQAAA